MSSSLQWVFLYEDFVCCQYPACFPASHYGWLLKLSGLTVGLSKQQVCSTPYFCIKYAINGCKNW